MLGEQITFDIEKLKLEYDDPDGINIIFCNLDEVKEFFTYLVKNYAINYFDAPSDFIDKAEEQYRRHEYIALDRIDIHKLYGVDDDSDFYESDYYYSDIIFEENIRINIKLTDLIDFLIA